MSRTTVAATALTAALALPAAASTGSTGPFVGTIGHGQTRTHYYDNAVTRHCVDLAAAYDVVLSYAPASDALTLTVAGETATGVGGVARVSFVRGVCAEFPITITGTSVAVTAAYVVTVARGLPGQT